MTKTHEAVADEKTKEKLALAKRDIEIFNLEKTLEPYAMGQYDIKMREQQMQWLLRQDVMSNFSKGCILLDVKERENAKTFSHFLENSCGGMTLRSAQHYMLYAKKCIELKKVKEFGEKNWSKMIALLHSSTDEELQEIEKNGIKGKALSEFDGYSVRDFKRELKRLTEEKDKIVTEETRNISLQLNRALEENKQLKTLADDPKTPEGFAKIFELIELKTGEIFTLSTKIKLEDAYRGLEGVARERIREEYRRSATLLTNQFNNCIARLEKSLGIDTGI